MKRKNKACVFCFYPGGGIASMTKCFVDLLQDLKYEVEVFYFEKFWKYLFKKSVIVNEINYKRLPYIPIPCLSQMNYLIPSYFLGTLLKEHDVLISISGSFHTSLPFIIQKRKHITKVATTYYEEHISKFKVDRFKLTLTLLWIELKCFRKLSENIEKWLYRDSLNKTVLVDSVYTKKLLEKRHGSRESVHIFPYCLDINKYKPKQGTDGNEPVVRNNRYIFACGRFDDPRKNIDLLFNAYIVLLKEWNLKDVKLIVAGNCPKKESLLQKTGLTGKVELIGCVTEDQKIKLYQGASLFVLSSNQEGLGIVVLEAMACGAPVVSTRCGGPESVIENGINGLLSDIDANQLANRMNIILSDHALAERIKMNALKTVREKYSKDAAKTILVKAISKTKN